MVRTLHRTRRLVVGLTSAALVLTGLSVGSLALGASAASASDSSMLGQVNASRSAKGLSAYSWNGHLASVAREQAVRMAKKTKLYHNPNLASDVGSYRWVGENVGYGPSSSSIQKAFMNSTGHRANILDDNYTQIGIASVRDDDGRLWVAQVFRQPSGSSSSGSKSSKSSKPSNSAKKAKKRVTATSPTVKKRAKASTTRADATAPKAKAPAKRPAAPVATAPKPAPQPTLAQRVSYATSAYEAAPASADPLADALAFAATMNAVGG